MPPPTETGSSKPICSKAKRQRLPSSSKPTSTSPASSPQKEQMHMVSNAELRSLVDTVVVVMMENRSFDHTLGFLSHEQFDARSDIDGLHQHSATFDWDNPDDAGELYAPTATPDSYLPKDLPHSRTQIAQEIDGGAMDGFMR